MNISRRWLEAFLHRPLDARDLVERLAMLGAPVDAVEPLFADLGAVVVALVEDVRQHPNADRLRLCTVNDGGLVRRNVVCGAPNVTAGRKYPFARVGTKLPGGILIEKRKIRGEPSEGMLCSSRELRLGEEYDGLLELQTDVEPGGLLLDALPIADDRLVVDVTPNRADLLGHKGVAREIAASLGIPFRLPIIPGAAAVQLPVIARVDGPGQTDGVTVAVEDHQGCGRFAAAVIRGLRVGPSPGWLKSRLEAVGLRSISNVVDVTNYIMFELNQPLHAYDLHKLRGATVIARRARAGEKLVTLDGVERALTTNMTVIADGAGAIGIAGVMGGRDSEVSAATTDVFLESAWWAPTNIRATRRTLGMTSEAAYRFERGTDLWAIPDGLRRCLELLLTVAGGTVADSPVDVWPHPTHPPRIFLRQARVAQVLGAELPLHTIEQHLVSIGAQVVSKPADGRLAVDVPGWRPDLQAEIDLIEEVARRHGYDQFPSDLRPFRPAAQIDPPREIASARVRRGLIGQGLFEVVTLPMGPADGPESVALLNPLSAEHGFLRPRLLTGLLKQVEKNWANQIRDVRLFEIGTVFAPGPRGGRPVEATHVAGVISGAREPRHWTGSNHGPDMDLWDLKGLFQAAIGLAIPRASVHVEGEGWRAVGPDERPVGRAVPLTGDRPPWAAPCFGFEVALDESDHPGVRFRPLPTTPAVERDLALLVPLAVSSAEVGRSLTDGVGPLLESARVIDEYRGAAIPAGRRSVAFRLTLRSADRTLRDAEVDAAIRHALATLERSLDVVLRTA